ncbi:MAG: hypothetical protein M1831_001328 [Alyxoria varia]|nr:MAG: hypothetical protein M1831_001328 [Alyxoria varia]
MAGDVTIAIKDTKLSPTACTYHVSVIQHDRECVVGYIKYANALLSCLLFGSRGLSCANLHSVEGISLPTNFRLDPAPPPSHLESLASKGADDMWISYSYPWYSESPTKALSHWRHFVPRCKTTHPSIVEFWVRVIPDDLNITTEMLGTVVDQYPRPIENYRQGSPISATALAKGGARQLNGEQLEDEKSVVLPHQYTILSLGLEIKKPLPAAGVRWLFLRVRARKIENGRFDSEVIVSDENFELVAVSNQVNLILDKGPGSGSKRRIAASLASQKL